MSVGSGTQNCIIFFGIKEAAQCTVSFLGIHKWEPDIYIGFSPALHWQCVNHIKIPKLTSLFNFEVFDTKLEDILRGLTSQIAEKEDATLCADIRNKVCYVLPVQNYQFVLYPNSCSMVFIRRVKILAFLNTEVKL